jgi:hypothetical protein
MTPSLSQQYKNGIPVGFKKFVFGKSFFLGADQPQALKMAKALMAKAEELKAAGQQWTDQAISEAKASVGAIVPQPTPLATQIMPTPLPAAQQAPVASSGLTIHQCLEAYKQAEVLRAAAKQISQKHASGNCFNADMIKTSFEDGPLAALSLSQLKSAVGHWTARPASKRLGSKGKPIAVATVLSIARTMTVTPSGGQATVVSAPDSVSCACCLSS